MIKRPKFLTQAQFNSILEKVVKYGGSPSYVKRDGNIIYITDKKIK